MRSNRTIARVLCIVLACLFVFASCGESVTDPTTGADPVATTQATTQATTAGTQATTAGTQATTEATTVATTQATTQATTEATTSGGIVVVPTDTYMEMTDEELYDRVLAAWYGQMLGVSWAGDTEFKYKGTIIPADKMPAWSAKMINEGFAQDDTYVEIPMLMTLYYNGAFSDVDAISRAFRDAGLNVFHANKEGYNNLMRGITAPDSGSYVFNAHCDDIDWQIECDYLGMAYPCLVTEAAQRAFEVGHIMNYGDGVYGGVFVSAMHAAAYNAKSIREIVDAGISVIPAGTRFRKLIDRTIDCYDAGKTWEETWQILWDEWGDDDRCPEGAGNAYNIDAKMNAAYVVLGLLYGEGDVEKTCTIATRCGSDSDCNPSTALSVLGSYLGSKPFESYFTALEKKQPFGGTAFTLDDVINANYEVTKEVITAYGATLTDGVWSIPTYSAYKEVPYEQWPTEVAVDAGLAYRLQPNGGVAFQLTTTGTDAVASVSFNMGDGNVLDYVPGIYYYGVAGTYTVKYTVTGTSGASVTHAKTVRVTNDVYVKSTAVTCTTTSNKGYGNKGGYGLIGDGLYPEVGAGEFFEQYSTYDTKKKVEKDEYAITFADTEIKAVEFVEGMHYAEGGWFASEPEIYVRIGTTWTKAECTISTAYPGDSQEEQGANFEHYVFTLKENVKCSGVKIAGVPGGTGKFSTAAELMAIPTTVNQPNVICSMATPNGSNKFISNICDGNTATQYDSYYDLDLTTGKDFYIGYVYDGKVTANSLTYDTGAYYDGGGWFDNAQIWVEVLVNGTWTKVESEISKDYPAATKRGDVSDNDQFVFTFADTECEGVRLAGKAGGTQGFVCVAELTVGLK